MSATSSTTVALGRFDDLLARGLRGLIEDDQSLELVAADVRAGQLAIVLRARRPRVAILDAGSLRSPVEVRALTAAHPTTSLLLLADEASGVECAQLLAFGAAACLAKAAQARDVLNAIHLASRGLQLIPRNAFGPRDALVARAAADGAACGVLTPRESDVLAELRRHRSNGQIAADLHISIETVRTHARHIYRKLGVASRRELFAQAPATAARTERQLVPRRGRRISH